MKIAIIGAGDIGGTLGRGWGAAGHEVVFGVRDSQDPKVVALLRAVQGRTRATTLGDAAAAGDVVVFTSPRPATHDAISAAGSLSGKIVIDAANPSKPDLSGLALGHTASAAEQVAGWAAGAKVVKAFTRPGGAHDTVPLTAMPWISMAMLTAREPTSPSACSGSRRRVLSPRARRRLARREPPRLAGRPASSNAS